MFGGRNTTLSYLQHFRSSEQNIFSAGHEFQLAKVSTADYSFGLLVLISTVRETKVPMCPSLPIHLFQSNIFSAASIQINFKLF